MEKIHENMYFDVVFLYQNLGTHACWLAILILPALLPSIILKVYSSFTQLVTCLPVAILDSCPIQQQLYLRDLVQFLHMGPQLESILKYVNTYLCGGRVGMQLLIGGFLHVCMYIVMWGITFWEK